MVGLLPSRSCATTASRSPTASAVPTRYLCELARRHVTVALSGDAGDEIVRRLPALRLGARRRPAPAAARARFPRLVAAALGARAGRPGALAARVRRAPRRPTRRRATCASSVTSPPARRRDIYTPELRERFARDATAEAFAGKLAASAAGDVVSRLQDLDCDTYLPDDILAKVDIASMSHGLEARAPFCDHDVVELGAALPGRFKLRRGKGKLILKQAFADLVPPAIIERRKKGFALPTGRWLAGRLHGFARELLLSTAARAARACSRRPRSSRCSTGTAPARTTASGSGTSWSSRPGFASWSTGGRRSCARSPRARPRLAAARAGRRRPCSRRERRDRRARSLLA